jgi:hypothetical protein
MVPREESAQAAAARAERIAWLQQRDYRVIAIPVAQIEDDLPGVLDRLAVDIGAES